MTKFFNLQYLQNLLIEKTVKIKKLSIFEHYKIVQFKKLTNFQNLKISKIKKKNWKFGDLLNTLVVEIMSKKWKNWFENKNIE